jgi:hypothetical protein
MRPIAAIAIAASLALTACQTTSIANTWKKPGLGPNPISNVVVFAAVQDPATRRTIEDKVVQKLGGQAVQSYVFAPDASTREQLRTRVLGGGFDGAIVMRLVSVDKQEEWVPGMWVDDPYGFGTYDPGYVAVDTYVRVETNIYSVPDEQLIWAATSESVNPTSLGRLIDDTVNVVVERMRKEGLMPAVKPQARASRP